MAKTDPRYEDLGFSLSGKDATEGGFFSDGPATIVESIFAYAAYANGPTVVWMVKYGRGEGADRETYQQHYGIGKGWSLTKEGRIISPGHGLPKSCNAYLYLVTPLEALFDSQGVPPPPNGLTNPRAIEGLEVNLKRVQQVERNMQDREPRKDRREDQKPAEPKAPSTILTIERIISVPWQQAAPKGKVKNATPVLAKAAPARDPDDDDDAPMPVAKPNGKAATPAPASNGALTEEAVEAVIKLLESGSVKTSQLEQKLEGLLADHPQAAAIIDLATSNRFLMSERGWSLSKDGKTLDAAVAE